MTTVQLNQAIQIEKELALKDIQRIRLALKGVQENAANHHIEWSLWDEAYKFGLGKNESFEENYLNYDGLSITTDQYILSDLNGEILSSGSLDHGTATLRGVSSVLLQLFEKTPSLRTFESNSESSTYPYESVKSIVTLEDGVYFIVSGYLVDNTNKEAPPSGVLLFAKKISEEIVEKISEQTQLPIMMYQRNSSDFNQELSKFTSFRVDSNQKFAVYEDAGSFNSSTTLYDINSEPSLILSTTVSERIFERNKSSITMVLKWITGFAFLILLLTYALLKFLFINPVNRLYIEIKSLSSVKGAQRRVSKPTGKELGAISEALNSSLESIESYERKLKKAQAEAENANQAKSTFIARVSHELRTPLAGIIGLNSMLTRRNSQKELTELLKLQGINAEGLLTLINEILDFSAVEKGQLTFESIEFNPRKVAKEAIETVAGRVKEGVKVTLIVAPNVPAKVKGDPTRLKQILVNLLGNSIKFTEKGEVGLELAGNLTAKVWDTGIGIPKDKINSIFEPFKQADESITRVYQGTGLGLAIVKQTVEAQGGKVWVESEEGKGSQFYVEIPYEFVAGFKAKFPPLKVLSDNSVSRTLKDYGITLSDSSDLVIVTEEDLVKEINKDMIAVASAINLEFREMLIKNGVERILTSPFLIDDLVELFSRVEELIEKKVSRIKQLRILVADDTRTNRIILEDILKEAGHEVICVEDGVKVFETLEKDQDFDLLLTDISMPRMDGYAVARKIKDTGVKLPVVAITAHVLEEEQAKMREAGMDDILFKPVRPENLDRVIENLIS